MLQRVFEVDSRAADLQVNQAVPHLLRLLVCEHPNAICFRRVTLDVLEDIVIPKDRVLHILFVRKSSHGATVLIRGELEYVSLDLHVNVVVEKAVATHLPLHEHLQRANQIAIAHLGDEHGKQADHTLEEVIWDHVGD